MRIGTVARQVAPLQRCAHSTLGVSALLFAILPIATLPSLSSTAHRALHGCPNNLNAPQVARRPSCRRMKHGGQGGLARARARSESLPGKSGKGPAQPLRCLLRPQRFEDCVGGVGVEAGLKLCEEFAGDGGDVADAGHGE